jgi:hypothetical protein
MEISKIRILIYGANGWLGEQFCNYLSSENVTFFKGTERLENEKQLECEILKGNQII